MTVSPLFPPGRACRWLGMLVALGPAALFARPAPPVPDSAPTQTTVVVLPPPPAMRFEQSMRQQLVRDRLQKNLQQEQLRQHTMEAIRRPGSLDASQRQQLERADEADRALYRARQRGELDRYQDAVAPRAVVVHSRPAPASSD